MAAAVVLASIANACGDRVPQRVTAHAQGRPLSITVALDAALNVAPAVHLPAAVRPVPAPRVPERTRAPAPPAPLGIYAAGTVERLILNAFGAAGPAAVRVARCESGLRPGARSGPHAGLFQINVRIHAARIARMGYTQAQMFEAAPNIAVALALYRESGWRPWTCRP